MCEKFLFKSTYKFPCVLTMLNVVQNESCMKCLLYEVLILERLVNPKVKSQVSRTYYMLVHSPYEPNSVENVKA